MGTSIIENDYLIQSDGSTQLNVKSKNDKTDISRMKCLIGAIEKNLLTFLETSPEM